MPKNPNESDSISESNPLATNRGEIENPSTPPPVSPPQVGTNPTPPTSGNEPTPTKAPSGSANRGPAPMRGTAAKRQGRDRGYNGPFKVMHTCKFLDGAGDPVTLEPWTVDYDEDGNEFRAPTEVEADAIPFETAQQLWAAGALGLPDAPQPQPTLVNKQAIQRGAGVSRGPQGE